MTVKPCCGRSQYVANLPEAYVGPIKKAYYIEYSKGGKKLLTKPQVVRIAREIMGPSKERQRCKTCVVKDAKIDTLTALASTIQGKLDDATNLNAQQQETIAMLQARVAELEFQKLELLTKPTNDTAIHPALGGTMDPANVAAMVDVAQ